MPMYRIAFLIMLFSASTQASDKLYLYTEQFPPYNMTDNGQPFAHKADEITGLCTDMVKAIIKRIPYDVKMKLRNWNYGLDRAKQKADHGIFCTARNEERESWFQWVGPLTEIRWTLFAKAGSDIRLTTLEDARKYRIGGYKGDVMTQYLIDQGFNVSVVDSDAMNPLRLHHGQIDLWIADYLSGPYVASDAADLSDMEAALIFRSTPLYLALNKDMDGKIVKSIMQAHDALKKENVFSDIERVYGN